MAEGTDAAGGLERLTTLWQEKGISVASMEGSGSLAGRDRGLTVGVHESASGVRLADRVSAALAREPLELFEVLGRGGMGVVRRARQRALRRDVAVKQLSHREALPTLLKEAWVGGTLEHPHVVPVHCLARVDGEPAVVMKRIHGTSFREAIALPERVPAAGRADPLAFHVRVLIAACHAIAYAHRRGVLHLDLKPDNVMLGEHGEVCVLDWGLAAGHGAAAPEWLPAAASLREVSGTPDYMAPELATGAGALISPRTDVYLLGATLHEAVTGAPPHAGGTALQRLYRAFVSAPHDYGERTDAELAEILHRAMAREPERRFASAEAFREALEAWLAHRRGEALVRDAHDRVAALGRAVEVAGDEIGVGRHFGAARFALREAERARPGHPALPELRARTFRGMALWALGAKRIEAAERHLRELRPEDRGDLELRVADLRADAAARQAELARLEHIAREEDLDLGSPFRRQVCVLGGILLFLVHAGHGALAREHLLSVTSGEMFGIVLGTGLLCAPAVVWQRAALFRNHANLVLFGVGIATYFGVLGLWAAAWALSIPLETAVASSGIFYVLAGSAVSVLQSARFGWSAVVAALALIAAAIRPDLAFWMIGLGSGLGLANVGLSWGGRRGA